jgi:hypothetical protein
MNPEQKKFLQKRLRSAVASQPELKSLKSLLLKLGGEMLVAPAGPDADVPALLRQGFCMSGTVRLKVMERNGCHKNVASVWRHQKFGVVGVATGYALQTDGLWRQHSWGVLRDGILETTVDNSKYFGILMQGESADRFVALNSV